MNTWYNDYLSRSGLRIITDVVTEQISLTQARKHLRLDEYGSPPEHPDDDWLTDIGIPTAREYCEAYHGTSFAPKMVELAMGRFTAINGSTVDYCSRACSVGGAYSTGSGIQLPLGPVGWVVSVSYLDADGIEITLGSDEYTLDNYNNPAYLYPAINTSWPSSQAVQNSVKIRYIVGHTIANDSPNDIPLPAMKRSAMLLMLGHLYENRETTIVDPDVMQEIPLGSKALLDLCDRVRLGFA